MKECWVNVYPIGSINTPRPWFSGEEARAAQRPGAIARIHVRMKPEGAPKRYSEEAERVAWETNPEVMARYGKYWAASAPRAPDIEAIA